MTPHLRSNPSPTQRLTFADDIVDVRTTTCCIVGGGVLPRSCWKHIKIWGDVIIFISDGNYGTAELNPSLATASSHCHASTSKIIRVYRRSYVSKVREFSVDYGCKRAAWAIVAQ